MAIPVEGLTNSDPVASEWPKMETEINKVFSHCSCVCGGRDWRDGRGM